ncbi:glutathione S-transferase [Trametopsis cervina]|nr:glutathione S-transferase [Trametopsis cervina]
MAEQSNKIIVYSTHTPNGFVVPLYLHELQLAYPEKNIEYEYVKLSISDADIGKVHNQVKSPWFLEINPNGRIPAITHNGRRVFETSAILYYLSHVFDTEHKFYASPESNLDAWTEEQSWIYFVHGGIGPMQGQANHFNLFAKEKIPYAINRYLNETHRLYSVVEEQLGKHKYIAGDTLSIVDFKLAGWAMIATRTGLNVESLPRTIAWLKGLQDRQAWKDAEKETKG